MNALQNEITALAGKAGVSDIHFHVGLPLAFRQDGKLEVGTQQPCDRETLEQFPPSPVSSHQKTLASPIAKLKEHRGMRDHQP